MPYNSLYKKKMGKTISGMAKAMSGKEPTSNLNPKESVYGGGGTKGLQGQAMKVLHAGARQNLQGSSPNLQGNNPSARASDSHYLSRKAKKLRVK